MVLAAGLGMAACSSNSQGPGQGSEGGACFPNQTCNAGLTCLSNLCVNAGGDAGLDASGDTGSPVADGGDGGGNTGDASDGGNTGDASDGGQFEPSSLSGLAIWLEGDVGVGSTTWADQSPHHDDFTSSTANPVASSTLNGHTMVDLTNGGLTGAGTVTIGTGPLFVELVVSHVLTGEIFSAGGFSPGGQGFGIGAKTASQAYADEYNITIQGTSPVDQVTANVPIGDGAAHIVGAQLDGTGNLTLRFDGAAVGGPTGGATLNLNKLPAIIGFAWFAEVIVVSGAVTSQQVSNVEAYLKTKYGL